MVKPKFNGPDGLSASSLPPVWYDQFRALETTLVSQLCAKPLFSPQSLEILDTQTQALLHAAHPNQSDHKHQAAFLSDFNLGTEEGIALLCLAEALPLHPNSDCAQALIAEKMQGSWQAPLSSERSLWGNVSALAFYLTGRAMGPATSTSKHVLAQALRKIGGSVAQGTITQAITRLGERFILAESIENALKSRQAHPETHFNFECLSPPALTATLAQTQVERYLKAIDAIAAQPQETKDVCLTLRLSSIYERLEPLKFNQLHELRARAREIVLYAAQHQVSLIIDAEESWRWECILSVFETLIKDPELPTGYHGLGITLHAYLRSTTATLDWLTGLAKSTDKRIPVRLLKGTYAQSEVIWSQNQSLKTFPIFTQKSFIDLSFLHAAQQLLAHPTYFHASFSTHNPRTIAALSALAIQEKNTDFELQYVFGLGETLIKSTQEVAPDFTYRLYSPIGPSSALLPFLIRQLFENSSSSWFLNTKPDQDAPDSGTKKILDPQQAAKQSLSHPKQSFADPQELFQPERTNTPGPNLSLSDERNVLEKNIAQFLGLGYGGGDEDQPIRNPADRSQILGYHHFTSAQEVIANIEQLKHYWPTWRGVSVHERTDRLERLAQLIEANTQELIALCVLETTKTLPAAAYEVRQAANYCRLHASQANRLLAQAQNLPGALGQQNQARLYGRGIFACISPSSSPLASLVGQTAAALVTGNCVIAKPSSHAELVARKTASLFYQAGFTQKELCFTPTTSRVFSTVALSDRRLNGVSFAGSTENAQNVKLQLNQVKNHFYTLLLSTGGLNAMLIDSTVATEQVVPHIVNNAFNCAGQLPTSLNCVFVPLQSLDELLTAITGRTKSLRIGNPRWPWVDVGPMMTEAACKQHDAHLESLSLYKDKLLEVPIPEDIAQLGYYATPRVIVLDSLKLLTPPPPGPTLHVIPYQNSDWGDVINNLNQLPTLRALCVYSKLNSRIEHTMAQAQTLMLGINHPLSAPAVGCQPCGGRTTLGYGLGSLMSLTSYLSEQYITTSMLDTCAPRY